ncbi:MAG: HAMP domain-containing histidine kinase [Kiritimatiellae bacterium]|nr:HAMP domain-containing histidine kinase [Kiritimatiellia bacterium]MDW8459462.1 HAMP domain-containing sensor histidine kinase [Verrucomicrobiota bacterium]
MSQPIETSGIPRYLAHYNRTALVAAAVYFTLSAIYIAVSDRLAADWAAEPEFYRVLQTAKGIGFVGLTSLVLFGLLQRLLRRMARDRQRIAEQQDVLVAAERRAAISLMAGAVAHDMNNVLAVGLANAEMLNAHGSLDSAGRQMLRDIVESFDRLHELTRRMSALERPAESLPKTRQDLMRVVRDAARWLQRHPAMSDRLLAISGPNTAEIEIHEPMIRDLLQNLVINAAEAVPPRGRVEIWVEDSPGEVVIEVHDNGPGISAEQRERIFNPFYTTKSSGLGLGLVSARAIARAHGGTIEASESPLGGACLRVKLPKRASG